jgi:hypothetical protein
MKLLLLINYSYYKGTETHWGERLQIYTQHRSPSAGT